jgi:hypothetical protein
MRNIHKALRPQHLILVSTHQLDQDVSRITIPPGLAKFPRIAETAGSIRQIDL